MVLKILVKFCSNECWLSLSNSHGSCLCQDDPRPQLAGLAEGSGAASSVGVHGQTKLGKIHDFSFLELSHFCKFMYLYLSQTRICSVCICVCFCFICVFRLDSAMFSWMGKEGVGGTKNGDVYEGVAEGLKGVYKYEKYLII